MGMNNITFLIYSFMVGISIGSFINVILWRLPRKESIISPRSYCPKCQNQITWKDNIPIISWIILDGKCRFCSQKISLRYPIIELITTNTIPQKEFDDINITVLSVADLLAEAITRIHGNQSVSSLFSN